MKEKICAFCGELFIPVASAQKYCKRSHYMNCPVCGKRYLVTNNENLKRPPVACSYECRAKRTRETSLERYGTLAPGNNPEARKKAKNTMQERYGVDYAMQSDEIYAKGVKTMQEKYGVNNIRQLSETVKNANQTRRDNWRAKLDALLPYKYEGALIQEPLFGIDDNDMDAYILREEASTTFLKQYGHVIAPKFGKIHTSLGLVKDGILYQVLRFERKGDEIILANFGIRRNYFNPNYYAKLLGTAISTIGIDSFTCTIPRTVANDELVQSLSLELVAKGDYIPYWKMGDQLKQVVQTDDIEKMLQEYNYTTSDYLDVYAYKCKENKSHSDISEIFISQH